MQRGSGAQRRRVGPSEALRVRSARGAHARLLRAAEQRALAARRHYRSAERRRTRPLRARTRSRGREAKPEQVSVGGRRRPKGKRISRSGSGEASFLLAAPRGDFCQRLFSTSDGSSDLPAVRVPCRATARVLMHEAVDLPGSLGDPVPCPGDTTREGAWPNERTYHLFLGRMFTASNHNNRRDMPQPLKQCRRCLRHRLK